MDINELKKLINEEVKRTRQKNLLKEQGGEEKTGNIHAPNVQIRRAATGKLPGGEEITQHGQEPVNPSYEPISREVKLDQLRKEAIPLLKDKRINDPKLYKILASIVNSNNIEDLKNNFLPLSKKGETTYSTTSDSQEVRELKQKILTLQNRADILAKGSGKVEKDPSKTGFIPGTDPSDPRWQTRKQREKYSRMVSQEPTNVDPSGPTRAKAEQPVRPIRSDDPTKTNTFID